MWSTGRADGSEHGRGMKRTGMEDPDERRWDRNGLHRLRPGAETSLGEGLGSPSGSRIQRATLETDKLSQVLTWEGRITGPSWGSSPTKGCVCGGARRTAGRFSAWPSAASPSRDTHVTRGLGRRSWAGKDTGTKELTWIGKVNVHIQQPAKCGSERGREGRDPRELSANVAWGVAAAMRLLDEEVSPSEAAEAQRLCLGHVPDNGFLQTGLPTCSKLENM